MSSLVNIEKNYLIKNETLILLLEAYETKGKDFFYLNQFSEYIKTFEQLAIEKNLQAFNSYLDLSIVKSRVKQIANKNPIPKNNSEMYLTNLRSVFERINTEVLHFDLIVNEVLDLGNLMYRLIEEIKFSTTKNPSIGALKSSTISMRSRLEEFIEYFENDSTSKHYEKTYLILSFYVDIYNAKIFTSNNKEIADILLYVLLLKEFQSLRFTNYFKHFLNNHDKWNKALDEASFRWSDGLVNLSQLHNILVRNILQCYQEIEIMSHQFSFESDLNKTDSIENTIYKLKTVFSKNDIRKLHPTISDATIDRTLARLKVANIIRPIGVGRSAKWQRLKNINDKYEDYNLFNL